MSSNSVYLGPGYWASWHTNSLFNSTPEQKKQIVDGILMDIDGFPCNNCRIHSLEYVNKNHPSKYVNSEDHLSIFKWTVNFHNAVNLRIDKKVIHWEEARDIWLSPNSLCTDDCGDDKKLVVEIPSSFSDISTTKEEDVEITGKEKNSPKFTIRGF